MDETAKQATVWAGFQVTIAITYLPNEGKFIN